MLTAIDPVSSHQEPIVSRSCPNRNYCSLLPRGRSSIVFIISYSCVLVPLVLTFPLLPALIYEKGEVCLVLVLHTVLTSRYDIFSKRNFLKQKYNVL
jgi:hypothetical protein